MTAFAFALALQAAALPATGSCLAAAPAVGTDPAALLANAVDGATLKSFRDVARLSDRADGKLVVIRGGDLTGAEVGRRRLRNICFVGTKLARSDWRRAETSGLGFIGADLSGALLAGARLQGVLLRESDLGGVDATGAILDGGRLDGGWSGSLARLKLDRASMRGFSVVCGTGEADGCPFERAGMSVRGTDFTLANLATFSFWDARLDGAILDRTQVGLGQVGQLDNLVIRGPVTVHSRRRRATLQPAEYTAVRAGVRPIVRAGTGGPAPRREPSDAAACASVADRRERAICDGGSELQALAAAAAPLPRTGPAGSILAARETFCANLSDDLIARCLTSAYRNALAVPEGKARTSTRPEALRSLSLFATLPVTFTDDFRRSPLYMRMLPLFVDSAPTQLVAVPLGSGTFRLAGASQSGCRIAVPRARFNPATGWYVASVTQRRTGGRAVTRTVPVARFTATGAEVAAATATCPDGATLDPLLRVEAPGSLIELLTEGNGG